MLCQQRGGYVEFEDEYLMRVANRMQPYVKNNVILVSRLDRVLGTLGPLAEGKRDAVISALEARNVQVVNDPFEDDSPAPTADQGGPEITQSRSWDKQVAIARRRLALDRTEPKPQNVILTAAEEAGLSWLVRRSIGGALPIGGFGQLRGEARRAAECLLLHNQRLVHSIVAEYSSKGMAHADMFQYGTIGLVRAIELFDPNRDLKFSTYATNWIRQAITRGIANDSRLIRLPVHLHDRVLRVWRVRDRLTINGEPPSVVRLARQCELTKKQVVECLRLGRIEPGSLDAPVGDGLNTLAELIQADDNAESPEGALDKQALHELIDALMSSLSMREADIISRRFGLNSLRSETLEEIGLSHGITRERVRQIERDALKRLRLEFAGEIQV
jgi:RNA polymerase primary sigma factor